MASTINNSTVGIVRETPELDLLTNSQIKRTSQLSMDKYRGKVTGNLGNFKEVSNKCSINENSISAFASPVEKTNRQLLGNVNLISGSFINNNDSVIGREFLDQLDVLGKMIATLQRKFHEVGEKKVQEIDTAVMEIDEKIGRLGIDRIGGFSKELPPDDKLEEANAPEATIKFQKITKYVGDVRNAERLEKYCSELTADLNEAPSLTKYNEVKKKLDEANAELKRYKAGVLKSGIIRGNLGILRKNIGVLENHVKQSQKSSADSVKEFERGLNLVQQACFSAWVFNDIRKAVGKVIGDEEALNFLPEKNKKMLSLNQEARNTEMFQEYSLKDLFGKEGEKEYERIVQESKGDGKKAMKVFIDSEPKFGTRGRLGADGNQGAIEEQEFEKDLNKEFPNDNNIKRAIFSSVKPHRTANLKCVRRRDIEELNKLLKDDKCKGMATKIATKLVEKKLAVWGKGHESILSTSSYANVIDKAGLSTHCGPSGTTGEFFSVLRYTQPEKMKQIFSGILEISETGKLPKDFNCSEVLGMVALFMETGHCHTTAEAIGGLYSVAVADHNVEKALGSEHPERKNTSQGGYGNLLNAFKNNMSAFLEPKNAIA